MYPYAAVLRVRELVACGLTSREISVVTGVPISTVRHWRQRNRRASDRVTSCFRCREGPVPAAYPYMLGMYLGDGHIVIGRRQVQSLSVACDDNWPGVRDAVTMALGELLDTSVCHVQRIGCTEVKSYSKHWTCLFPQHGPGLKHSRRILLEPWQQSVVDEHPAPFLRGLFHSDGCRVVNRTRAVVGGVEKTYEYPRWMFSNTSEDILALCAAALDRLGIAHRRSRVDNISVARREAVAEMDRVVGPKS